jgi:integrase
MTTMLIPGALVPVDDTVSFADAERLALVGFLAGYRGLTRQAYTIDLLLFTAWCTNHDLALLDVRRVDIECYARELESVGRARSTVARRLCTLAGFFRYAEQEGLIERSPAVHVRRPRLDYESHTAALDRNELGALLVAAGLAGPFASAKWTSTRRRTAACALSSAPQVATPSSRRDRADRGAMAWRVARNICA